MSENNPLEEQLIRFSETYEDHPFGLPSWRLVQLIKGQNLTDLTGSALKVLALLEEVLES